MKRNHVIFCIFFLLMSNVALAFDDGDTHPRITKMAIVNSKLDDILRNNLGLKEGFNEIFKNNDTGESYSVFDWLWKGSQNEDNPACRASNHFHNPLKAWNESGVNDFLIKDTWRAKKVKEFFAIYCDTIGGSEYVPWNSNITWATGEVEPGKVINLYNWNMTRTYYDLSLIYPDKEEREKYLAKTFEGLGHILHLLQDMAVPSHARNDFLGHVPELNLTGFYFKEGFEGFVKQHSEFITTGEAINIENAKPSDYWDLNIYTGSNPSDTTSQVGLSEYANANFLSRSTAFTENLLPTDVHYFPYPKLSSTTIYEESDKGSKTKYFYKDKDGETVNHLAVSGRLYKYLNFWADLQRGQIYLDDKSYTDYANLLLPKAVGYSAGLLNYFFRGDIDLIPNQGSEMEKGYLIQNNTDEDMEGTFEIWYDDKEGKRKYLWSSLLEIKKHDKSPSIDLQFPTDSIDKCKYMLVFRGKMGAEQGAIAGKVIDLGKYKYAQECMACTRAKIEQEMAKHTIDEQLIASSTKTVPIHKPSGSTSSESGGNIQCWEHQEQHSFFTRKTEPDKECLKQCPGCDKCYYEYISSNPAGKTDQQYFYYKKGAYKQLNAYGIYDNQVKCTPARQVDGTYLTATWQQAQHMNNKINYYPVTTESGPLPATLDKCTGTPEKVAVPIPYMDEKGYKYCKCYDPEYDSNGKIKQMTCIPTERITLYTDCSTFKTWANQTYANDWAAQTITTSSISPDTYTINYGDYEAMYLTSIEPDGNGKIATLTYWKTRIEEIPTYTYNITTSTSTTFTDKDGTKTDTSTSSYGGEHKNTSSYGYLLETHTKKYRCENDVFTEIE